MRLTLLILQTQPSFKKSFIIEMYHIISLVEKKINLNDKKYFNEDQKVYNSGAGFNTLSEYLKP